MGRQSFAHSLLDIDPDKPFCPACRDTCCIRDKDGNTRACPFCHCNRCGRLKSVHPDQSGCICYEDKKAKKGTSK